MIQTETLLMKWTMLDLAIKRVQNSMPHQLSSAIDDLELKREDYHQEMIAFVRKRLELESQYEGTVPISKDGESVWIDGIGQVLLQKPPQ
jgi:hypothetical protein